MINGTFHWLLRSVDLRVKPGAPPPRIHALRHRFAVRALESAYSGDSCHPIQCKAAIESRGSLPPNPDESCHPIGAQRRLG
jgi:hypothetical protein